MMTTTTAQRDDEAPSGEHASPCSAEVDRVRHRRRRLLLLGYVTIAFVVAGLIVTAVVIVSKNNSGNANNVEAATSAKDSPQAETVRLEERQEEDDMQGLLVTNNGTWMEDHAANFSSFTNSTNTSSDNVTLNTSISSSPTVAPPTRTPTSSFPTAPPTVSLQPEIEMAVAAPVYSRTSGCLTDRFDNQGMSHNNRLYKGQFLCSKGNGNQWPDNQFLFGVSQNGNLIWKDTVQGQVRTYYHHNNGGNNNDDNLYFALTTDGTFVMINDKNSGQNPAIIWQVAQQVSTNIGVWPSCIASHDCPYLHLHADGVMVLNWIEVPPTVTSPTFRTKNFEQAYKFS